MEDLIAIKRGDQNQYDCTRSVLAMEKETKENE
jgi:hypothetical protein